MGDQDPVDGILAHLDRLDAAQRARLECRILSRPGLILSCLSVWAYLHRDELTGELPQDIRTLVGRFWRTIDTIKRHKAAGSRRNES